MDAMVEVEAVIEMPALRVERLRQSASGPFRRVHQLDHPSLTYIAQPYREPARGCLGSPQSHRSFKSFGPAIFVPPNLPLHIHSPGFDNRPMLVLHFADEEMSRAVRRFEGPAGLLQTRCFDINERRILETIDRMQHEFQGDGAGRTAILTGLGLVLMGELIRYFDEFGSGRRPCNSALADWQMRRIIQRLTDGTQVPPAIDELAALCGIGRRHFMRAFRARTGLTAMEWVQNSTFDRAVRLLEDESLSVKAIATELGYRHPSSFATAFATRFGQSPRGWRVRRNALAPKPRGLVAARVED